MSNFIFKSFPLLVVMAGLLLSSNDAYASGGPMDPVPQFVNLLILIGIITFVYQSKIKPVLVARAEQIKNDLTRGQKELEIAQAHAEEVNKEYSELDAKIADIHSQAQEDIAAMKVSFEEQMKAEESRIASSTERSIQGRYTSLMRPVTLKFSVMHIFRTAPGQFPLTRSFTTKELMS